jgi:hypothetical protein
MLEDHTELDSLLSLEQSSTDHGTKLFFSSRMKATYTSCCSHMPPWFLFLYSNQSITTSSIQLMTPIIAHHRRRTSSSLGRVVCAAGERTLASFRRRLRRGTWPRGHLPAVRSRVRGRRRGRGGEATPEQSCNGRDEVRGRRRRRRRRRSGGTVLGASRPHAWGGGDWRAGGAESFISFTGGSTHGEGGWWAQNGYRVGRRGVGAKNITILAEMLLKLRFLWSFHLFYHRAT